MNNYILSTLSRNLYRIPIEKGTNMLLFSLFLPIIQILI